MDFELNQLQCTANYQNPGTASTDPDCANNGVADNKSPNAGKVQFVTPKRTGNGENTTGTDDILISYDLSKGGTVPAISIRFWTGSAWGTEHVISGGANAQAVGSINTSLISGAGNTGTVGGVAIGNLTPFTFGEASVSFDALFGSNLCGKFGSAYLKSRSSDSFTAEVKDFVAPEPVEIGNCPTSITTDATDSATVGGTISDQANLGSAVPDGADGTIEFALYGPFATAADISCTAANLETDYDTDGKATVNVVNHNVTGSGNTKNPYTSPSFTTNQTGIYQWVATFTPTAGRGLDPSSTSCPDTTEQSTVNLANSTLNSAQSWVPNDTATLNHGGPAGYSVTFTLLKNVSQTDCQNNTYAAGNPAVIYGPTARPVSAAAPFTASSNNTTAVTQVDSGDTYRWKIEAPATATNKAVTSCVEATAFSSLAADLSELRS
jgi:hypothetical protein